MKKVLSVCAVCALVVAAGCGRKDSVAVEMGVVKGGDACRLLNSAKEFGGDEDIIFTDSVSLMMPQTLFGHDVASLRDSIFKVAFDTVAPDYGALVSDYMARTVGQFGYAVEHLDSVPDGVVADGFNMVSGTVVNLSPELLVYSVMTSDYQPRAAHGMTTVFYINYDIPGERVLTAGDIFDASKADALAAAIQTQADALEQVIGPTTIVALPAGGNFMISNSGEIEFVYQPYEVASYAQGAIRVSFYPYELAEYMTPFGIQYFKLGDLN